MLSTRGADQKEPLVLSGSHYDLGFIQGNVLQHRINEAIEVCLSDSTFRAEKPWWMPTWLYVCLAKRTAARMLEKPILRHYPAMHERVAGFADGSWLDSAMCYFITAFEPMLASVSNKSRLPAACSALAVRGARSGVGEPFIVRNMDYAPVLRPYLIVRSDRPRGRYRSVQFGVATNCGALDGVNEHGLCITYNYAHTTDDAVPHAPLSTVITEALQTCRTVREAEELIAASPRWGGAILMLMDADGDLASMEVSSTQSAVRRPAPGEDVLFHTNFFSTAKMKAVQVSEHAVFTSRAPGTLAGHRVLASAEERFGRLRNLTSAPAPIGLEEAIAIMGDHGPSGIAGQNTVCVHSAHADTIASLQYFPRTRRMRVDFTHACRADHVELSV